MQSIELGTKTSYDEIPYESHPFPQSHPDRLATVGRIFGMNPAPVTKCRVLELGCASGGNLIPMAFNLRDSDFLGVDLSVQETTIGQATIQGLGLPNIRIAHASILDIDKSWGQFDFIISHGVYSWVPQNIQEKMLAICSDNLNPSGIAYISYNTYPGWHMREAIRRMMTYHIGQFSDNRQRLQQARALIEFLANSVPTDNSPYGMLLKSELEIVKKSQDYYLFHDHLEEVNLPVYFHQFAERAAVAGLQYLGEADFSVMLTSGFSPEVKETLQRISPNIINTEQYMDFLRNRFFRQTLLCHHDVALKRNLGGESVSNLLFASAAQPLDHPVDLTAHKKVSFRTPDGASIETNRPLTKAVFLVLREYWPRAINLDTLLGEAYRKLDGGGLLAGALENSSILAADLLQCYSARVVELHTWQADFVTKASERPQVTKLAAYFIAQGKNIVANQRHEAVSLNAVEQQLVGFLDGSKDRAAMEEHLFDLVQRGKLTANRDGSIITNPDQVRAILDAALDAALEKMASASLFCE